MDPATLHDTLPALLRLPREQATVEFKSNPAEPEDIGQCLSSLANTAALQGYDRAWLVRGVAEDSHAITGTVFDGFSGKSTGRPRQLRLGSTNWWLWTVSDRSRWIRIWTVDAQRKFGHLG